MRERARHQQIVVSSVGADKWWAKVGGWVFDGRADVHFVDLFFLRYSSGSSLFSNPGSGSGSDNNIRSWWSIEKQMSFLQRKQWPELGSSGGGDCGWSDPYWRKTIVGGQWRRGSNTKSFKGEVDKGRKGLRVTRTGEGGKDEASSRRKRREWVERNEGRGGSWVSEGREWL